MAATWCEIFRVLRAALLIQTEIIENVELDVEIFMYKGGNKKVQTFFVQNEHKKVFSKCIFLCELSE